MVVVLYCDNPQSARTVAKTIVEQLPYELVGTDMAVRDAERLGNECVSAIESGRRVGLGVLLVAVRTGSDEADFEAIKLL